MIYTVFILFFFSFVILIRKYTNYYSIVLCVQTLFLNLALISLLISIAKIGNYEYPKYAILVPDYMGYLFLSKIKTSIYDISRLQNIGFAGFLACLPSFLYRPERKKKLILFLLASSLLPLFYILFCDPYTKLNILDLLYRHGQNNRKFYEQLIHIITYFNYIWIVIYMTVPLGRLLQLSYRTNHTAKRKQLFSLFFTLLCLNLLCAFIFLITPIGQAHFSTSVDNLLGFPNEGVFLSYGYSYLPFLALVLSNVMLILLFRFRGLDRVDFFRDFMIAQMALKPNKNIKNILHTYKNEMLSINMIARQLSENPDSERREYLIGRLNAISKQSLSGVTKSLSTFKKIDASPTSCNVVESIENALSKVIIDSDITIRKNYPECVLAFCDGPRLEMALENILNNSLEAIRIANREKGVISITVKEEFEWISIKITDNGIGIPKKDLRKVFRAFYSTKSSSANWGIGLHYVFRSIKIMKGFVDITSEVNKYTTVTLILQQNPVFFRQDVENQK